MGITETIESLRRERFNTMRSIEAHQRAIKEESERLPGIEARLKQAVRDLSEELLGDGIELDEPLPKIRKPGEGRGPMLPRGTWDFVISTFLSETRKIHFTSQEFREFIGCTFNATVRQRSDAGLNGCKDLIVKAEGEGRWSLKAGTTQAILDKRIERGKAKGFAVSNVAEFYKKHGANDETEGDSETARHNGIVSSGAAEHLSSGDGGETEALDSGNPRRRAAGA